MNPIFKAVAESTQGGGLLGVTTVLFLATFIGWTVWAYWPANKSMMDELGRMPLEPDAEPEEAS